MKTLLAFLISVSLLHGATTHEQLQLKSGQVLVKAKIIAISGDTVTIVHSGGTANLPAEEVDLLTLTKAKMELEDRDAARAERLAEATKKAAQQTAQIDQEREDRIAAAKAMSAVREANQTRANLATLPPPTRKTGQSNITQQIAALKAAFPVKGQGSARVFIPRSGRNERPYIVSSTVAQLPDGSRYSSTTTRHNAGAGRIDVIQYDAPPEDVYSWYRGTIQTTTVEALPRTLQMVEARLAQDVAKFQQAANGLSASAQAQAQHTLYWFDNSLKPYIARWKALGQ